VVPAEVVPKVWLIGPVALTPPILPIQGEGQKTRSRPLDGARAGVGVMRAARLPDCLSRL
jgi:hypothetical protein